MRSALVLTHGLPGSGKSTLACALKELFPGKIRVAERDEIRAAILPADYHSRGHDSESEARVEARQHEILREGLQNGDLVVVSDTNLTEVRLRKLVSIALSYGAPVFHVHFDIPVEEAKRRNAGRASGGGRFVPEWVIDEMAEYGYSGGRLKFFSVALQDGTDLDGFEVLISDRRGSEPTMEQEIERIRLAVID